MKRKVVKQGHNAMTITLPAKWVKEQNITPQDELNIDIKGKELVVKKNYFSELDKTSFRMVGKEKHIHRHLGVLYRLGYDEIKVEFDESSKLDKIQFQIEQMPGYEIVDQGENYCIIRNVSTGLENEFDNLLRKIFLNLLFCGEESFNIINQNNIEKLNSLNYLARVNNRLTNFCERMLIKEGYKDYRKTILIYVMVCYLEQIADYYRDIFDYLSKLEKKPKISKDILEIYEKTNRIFEFYYKLFYSFDPNKLSDLKEDCLTNMEKIKTLIENKVSTDNILLLNLNLIIERIYHMTESLI